LYYNDGDDNNNNNNNNNISACRLITGIKDKNLQNALQNGSQTPRWTKWPKYIAVLSIWFVTQTEWLALHSQ
jgi:hypothetical protein